MPEKQTGNFVIDWAQQAVDLGAGEIPLTSTRWHKKATIWHCSAVSNAVRVPVIASGGANHPIHMVEAIQSGASAVLAASIFHDGEYTIPQVKHALSEMGVHIRPC